MSSQLIEMKRFPRKFCRFQGMRGISYVEVLIATVLIVLALVPAMEALSPGLKGSAIHASKTEQHYHITAKLEEVLAKSHIELDAEAVAINNPALASVNYSDLPTSPNRRLVYLSRYDADNADANGNVFDGVDEGILWVKVEIENSNLVVERLLSKYE